MSIPKIPIRIHSETKEITHITRLIQSLESEHYELISSSTGELILEQGSITIINIDTLESKLLSKITEMEASAWFKMIFVLPEKKSILVSTIARLGYRDIYLFPSETEKLRVCLKEALIAEKNKLLKEQLEGPMHSFFSFQSGSADLSRIHKIAKKVARDSSINILLTGETGTGKGLLARAIHQMSPASQSPFIDVLCTTIPEKLLESELFGHEAGAFTSAQGKKAGLFELADGGTIFLDEIADLPLSLQSKLLRVIEKKVLRRIGGLYDIPVNTRIITATNKDLEELIKRKLFRSDLFYRLNSVTIELPPLRSRGRDILLLAKNFIEFYNYRFGKKVKRIEKCAEEFILNNTWPGNVRELKNAVERAMLLTDGTTLKLKELHRATESHSENFSINGINDYSISISLNFRQTKLEKLKKIYAEQVLAKNNGNKSETAKILGLSRPTLDNLLR